MATQAQRLRDPADWLEHEKATRRLGFLVSDALAMKHVETLLGRVAELEAALRETVTDLEEHADGNVGDGCWDVHDRALERLRHADALA